MKKNFLFISLLALGLTAAPVVLTSCGDDDKTTVTGTGSTADDDDPYNYGADNRTADDSKGAENSYKCIAQILDGCMDIANEVGESKIGDPIAKWNAGQQTEALYAVESWYSFHSREDYSNNILSIRNAYYGSRDGSVAANSISSLIAAKRPQMDVKVKAAITNAYNAILAIPNPFRNNISCQEALTAQKKCAILKEVLKNLKSYIDDHGSINQNAVLDPVISTYVDNVVLPTYLELKNGNAALYDAVVAFQSNPSDKAFKEVATAWLEARQPWETSEAFLFGPVDAEGLDPNMDSWPLDQNAIVSILNSGNLDKDLDWTDGDSDDEVEAKQGVRGFHTLEFLTFRNGVARTLNDEAASGDAADLVYNADNAKRWANYMKQVAYLLKKDAATLYDDWSVSYNGGKCFADLFKEYTF